MLHGKNSPFLEFMGSVGVVALRGHPAGCTQLPLGTRHLLPGTAPQPQRYCAQEHQDRKKLPCTPWVSLPEVRLVLSIGESCITSYELFSCCPLCPVSRGQQEETAARLEPCCHHRGFCSHLLPNREGSYSTHLSSLQVRSANTMPSLSTSLWS